MLWQIGHSAAFRYRCQTGQAFSAAVLLAVQSARIEETLWTALRMFEERQNLMATMAARPKGALSQAIAERAAESQTDIDRIRAMLKTDDRPVTALRQAILSERTERTRGVRGLGVRGLGVRDWAWSDHWMERLVGLGMRPIVGLVHHGSGPALTALDHDSFAPGLAAHAGAVARRFPWVRDWTPVNEPLTTVRFSVLYGHWYPHHRAEPAFWQMLLNQIDATRGAMREIRQVTPGARLIRTEDFGHTDATPLCQPQADHDNPRRLATRDLLFGRLVRGHPFWQRLDDMGAGPRLDVIAAGPCPPDVIGMNHSVTSDRFLDDRVENYPPRFAAATAGWPMPMSRLSVP